MNIQAKLDVLDDLLLLATRPDEYDAGEIALIADLRSHYLRALRRSHPQLPMQPEPKVKNELPDLLKKPKVTKDITCPSCSARPGEPCKQMSSRGPHGKPTNKLLRNTKGKRYYHKSRREAVK